MANVVFDDFWGSHKILGGIRLIKDAKIHSRSRTEMSFEGAKIRPKADPRNDAGRACWL